MRGNVFVLVIGIAAPLCASAQTNNAPSVERGQMLSQRNMCVACHGTADNGGERTSGSESRPMCGHWKQ